MRGHCCMSPARREAVFWEAEAATGAAAVSAAPAAASRRVNVNVAGFMSISGSFNQFCERAAVCAATDRSRIDCCMMYAAGEVLRLCRAVGLDSSQYRRITKTRRDPKQPRMEKVREERSSVC